VLRVLGGALVQDGQFDPSLLLLPLRDPSAREAMRNSFVIGVAATIISAIIAIPLAWFVARLRFPGKSFSPGFCLSRFCCRRWWARSACARCWDAKACSTPSRVKWASSKNRLNGCRWKRRWL
jgi:hypothetical protein